ncbi:site-specific recombinase XerD [Pontibacter ummariensis]|uniref:Site-specific recombinase XerD n=1 Tax=Pontibacter ummariensis TaxID=1610492 RepID=A0A239IKC4_9BACT|nr:site-specific integrase [Pontibacter ummariensis]PRY09845.1 site-specific recombinase XerD [Pontibacter ummariensis]SNS92864.1 Site-specific recombinase XerD [Pontibacter ummariensis]
MTKRIRVLFYLKKPKSYSSGPVPIYLRITIDGKRAEISTGRECEPKKWNSSSGRASGTKETVVSLNAYLETLQAKAYEAHRQLLEEGESITAEGVKLRFLGKEEETRTLLREVEEHNRRMEALVGVEFAPNTLKGYKTSLRHLREFLEWRHGRRDVELRKVDFSFVSDYDFYLRSQCRCSANSVAKYIKHLKKVLNACLAHGWIDKDPFLHYKGKAKQVERVFLSEEELERIAAKEFPVERLSQVRDVFLFSCYTGLAYVDVQQLRRSDVRKGVDGERWVFKRRQKTDTPSRIPLLPAALAILDRYKEHPQCLYKDQLLPVLSNQKMNAYLKEIADVCGIVKPVTFHTARHTFATTVTLLNGVPMESVSKMLGHTSIKTTQHYAKVLDMKLSQDMRLLRNRSQEK